MLKAISLLSLCAVVSLGCAPAPASVPSAFAGDGASPAAPATVVIAPSVAVPPPAITPSAAPSVVAAAEPRCTDVIACAREAVRALQAKDMAALAALTHPKKGVRFSPYAYVDTTNDVVLKASELGTQLASKQRRVWGSFDGSGDPIDRTFAGYLARFGADKAFLKVKDPSLNHELGDGNTTNNAHEVYPHADIVELFTPPSADDQMDWAALRLVFEKEGGVPYLVGVIHSEWTI